MTRLDPEKNTNVAIAWIFSMSATTPVMNAIDPIKATKMKYLYLDAVDLNVYRAFIKKLKVTATQKPERFAMDCGA